MKVIAKRKTTKRNIVFLSITCTSMVAEQQFAHHLSLRPTDLLYTPHGKKHFTSLEILNLKIFKAGRLL